MAFLTERFPDRITRGAVGGPTWNTSVFFLPSGVDQRNNAGRTHAQHRFNVSHGIKTAADHAVADAFFRKARGRLHSFRFKDWTDYRLTRAQSRLVELTSTTFQLSKVYGSDEPTYEEVRPISRPVGGTVRVWEDAVELTITTNFTVDADTGIVTFVSPPGAAVLEASCEFDVPCRFDFDDKQGELVHRKPDNTLLLRWDSIAVVEDMRG